MKQSSPAFLFSAILSLAVVFLFAAAGCAPDPDPVDEPEEDPVEENDLEDPDPPANYFWPLLSHGQIVLSSTEVVDGPHLLESDTGFVGEFTRDTTYKGRIVWLVDKTDVFDLEWIALTFTVDYYALHEWQFERFFIFEIEGLEPEPGDEGVQVFELGLADEQDGFLVEIERLVLGKNQEGRFTSDPIDYAALDIVLKVVDKP